MMRELLKFVRLLARGLALLCLLSCCAAFVRSQERKDEPDETLQEIPRGSLTEIRNKQRVLLLVGRSRIIDCRDMARSILAQAARPENRTHRGNLEAYETIERKLNAYMGKYKSLSMAADLDDADFIVVFNVLQLRRNVTPQEGPLPEPLYPYGEMFVIVREPGNASPAPARSRIIWRSKKELMWVRDAAGDFISELKAARGEK